MMFRRNHGFPHCVMDYLMPVVVDGFDNYPSLIHGWDNSPRSCKNGLVLHGSNPELFRILLRKALEMCRHVPCDENLIFPEIMERVGRRQSSRARSQVW